MKGWHSIQASCQIVCPWRFRRTRGKGKLGRVECVLELMSQFFFVLQSHHVVSLQWKSGPKVTRSAVFCTWFLSCKLAFLRSKLVCPQHDYPHYHPPVSASLFSPKSREVPSWNNKSHLSLSLFQNSWWGCQQWVSALAALFIKNQSGLGQGFLWARAGVRAEDENRRKSFCALASEFNPVGPRGSMIQTVQIRCLMLHTVEPTGSSAWGLLWTVVPSFPVPLGVWGRAYA